VDTDTRGEVWWVDTKEFGASGYGLFVAGEAAALDGSVLNLYLKDLVRSAGILSCRVFGLDGQLVTMVVFLLCLGQQPLYLHSMHMSLSYIKGALSGAIFLVAVSPVLKQEADDLEVDFCLEGTELDRESAELEQESETIIRIQHSVDVCPVL
jgi:hypothetical protein